jgi:hypothetical protein
MLNINMQIGEHRRLSALIRPLISDRYSKSIIYRRPILSYSLVFAIDLRALNVVNYYATMLNML